MKMKKLLTSLLLVATLAVTAVGCSSDSGSSDDTAGGTTAAGETTATTEAGGVSGEITVYSREEGSGTRGAFVELMGVVDADGNDMTVLSANFINSTSGVLTGVAQDPNAIGYVSLGSLNDTVKAIKVDGVEATSENILSGDYAVARPFNVAYQTGVENELVNDLFAFIMSVDGQTIVEEEGFIPVPTEEVYTASGLSGTIKISGSTSVSPIMEKLKEAYIALNPDMTIEITSSGSSSGMKDAMAGTVDLGMASRELKDTELAELTTVVIAQDGIAMVVNNANTIEDITSEDVKNIYLGEKTEW